MTATCRRCGHLNNDGQGLNTENPTPVEGAVSVCLYCSAVSIFTGDGWETRRPTLDEYDELLADLDVARAIATAQQVRRRMKSGLN